MRRAVVEANCEQLSPPCPRASLPLPSTGACVNPTISGSLPLFILVPTQYLISVQAPGAQVCRCSTAVLDRLHYYVCLWSVTEPSQTVHNATTSPPSHASQQGRTVRVHHRGEAHGAARLPAAVLHQAGARGRALQALRRLRWLLLCSVGHQPAACAPVGLLRAAPLYPCPLFLLPRRPWRPEEVAPARWRSCGAACRRPCRCGAWRCAWLGRTALWGCRQQRCATRRCGWAQVRTGGVGGWVGGARGRLQLGGAALRLLLSPALWTTCRGSLPCRRRGDSGALAAAAAAGAGAGVLACPGGGVGARRHRQRRGPATLRGQRHAWAGGGRRRGHRQRRQRRRRLSCLCCCRRRHAGRVFAAAQRASRGRAARCGCTS